MDEFLDAAKPVVKAYLVKRLFGASLLGGVQGFLFGIAFNYVWDDVIEPILRHYKREWDREQEERRVKEQLDKIKEADNEVDFDDAVDQLD